MNVIVGGFLVLAPLLASRLSNRRSQVIAVGVVTLATAAALGIFTGKLTADQLAVRLASITLATLFGAGQLGRNSASSRPWSGPPTPSGWPVRWPPASSRRRPTTCSRRSARTLSAANAAAVYRCQGEQMVTRRPGPRPRGAGDADAAAEGQLPGRLHDRDLLVSARSTEPEAPMLAARGLDSLLWLPLLDPTATSSAPSCSPGNGTPGCRPRPWRPRELRRPRRPGHLRLRAVRAQTEVLEQVQALLLTTPPAWVAGFQVGATVGQRPGPDRRRLLRRGRAGRARLAFIPADARGKGLEASCWLPPCSRAPSAAWPARGRPACILNRLDRLVAREGGDEDFVTRPGRAAPSRRPHPARLGRPPGPPGAGPRLVQVAAPLGLGTQANESQGHLRPGHRLVSTPTGWSRPATPPASSSTGRCSRRRPPPTSPAPSTAWSSWSTSTPPAATTTTWPSSASNTTPGVAAAVRHGRVAHKAPTTCSSSTRECRWTSSCHPSRRSSARSSGPSPRRWWPPGGGDGPAAALDPVVLDQMAGMGLFGLPFPEEVGGMGADYTTLCLAIEELARVDSSVAITLEAAVGLGHADLALGTAAQHDRWLRPLAAGEKLGAFGLTEPGGGSDVGALTTWATSTATSG